MDSREIMIKTAFLEIYRNGYNATGINSILEKSGLTKGAMYHHFKSKKELVLASINEVLDGFLNEYWTVPLSESRDPVKTLEHQIRSVTDPLMKKKFYFEFKYGCPMNNLVQELSARDKDFALCLKKQYQKWESSIEDALRKGIKEKKIRKNINPDEVATFIVASIEGCIMTAKIENSVPRYSSCIVPLIEYINSLNA